MLSSFSLKKKLLAAFGAIATLLAITGIGSYRFLSEVAQKYDHVASINLGNSDSLSGMALNAAEIDSIMLRLANAHSAVETQQLTAAFQKSAKEYLAADKVYNDIPFVEGEAALYDAQNEKWKELYALANELLRLREAGTREDLAKFDRALNGEFRTLQTAHQEKLGDLINFQVAQGRAWSQKAQSIAHTASVLLLCLVVAGVSVSFALGIFFSDAISKSLARISSNIRQAATQTESTSQGLSLASKTLSSGSTEAAASLEETVASLEELGSMVKLNSQHASEASNIAQESRGTAERGELEIQRLIASMAEIAKESKKIEEIITVIDDIAFQTNLLALNAAVESARAGEHGKGFAVVADAVRGLAQRSSDAAKQITSLIHSSVEKSDQGARIADTSGAVLKDLVTSVKRMAVINSEIATASQEQSSGLGQIETAMHQLDTATQQTASSAEEVSVSSDAMFQQANTLNELVQALTILINGQRREMNSNAVDYEAPSAAELPLPAEEMTA